MHMINNYRRQWRHVAWGLALVLGSVASASVNADQQGQQGQQGHQGQQGKLSSRARDEASRKGSAKMDVIVRFRRAPGAAENMLVQVFGGKERHHLRNSSRWMALRLPASVVARLADHPNVEFVAADPPVSAAMDVARIAAGAPPPAVPESGFTGAGVTVAVVDSGVALHPEIQTLVAAVDFVNVVPPLGLPPNPNTNPLASVDPMGHGTHVAGIIAGNGSHSTGGKLAGVAPLASLVSVRVLDGTGHGQASDVLAGLQWILAHKAEFGIGVVNISLGHPVYETIDTDPLVQAVDSLWDAGIVVVCSAGNAGRSGLVTITSPCNSRKVITVGALNDRRTPITTDDIMATYSSKGPTAIDLIAKPDLVAPGNRIVSTRSAGSYLDTLFPERRVAADILQPDVFEHIEMSGTSMAAPIVAGTAALMLEQDPTLNPATVKARLMLSARKPPFGSPFITGAGVLDILGALRATGTVANAPSPRVMPDAATGLVAFENTAVLWGSDQFSLMALWSGVVWSDPTQYLQPIVWALGELIPNGLLIPAGELLPNGELLPDSELVPDAMAVAWTDTILWAAPVLNPDPATVPTILPLSIGVRDP
jgi:serine protease AprX